MVKPIIFKLPLSEVNGRLDPRANQPFVQKLRSQLEHGRYPANALGSIANFKKVIVNQFIEGTTYIGLENIKSSDGEYIPTADKKSVSSAAIFSSGDILFPKLRPYLNKTHLAKFDGICSTEFHVLKVLDVLPEYIVAILRTNSMVRLTSYWMTGNTLPRLQTKDIQEIPIPLPAKPIQQQVVDLMSVAYEQKKRLEIEASALLARVDGVLLKHLGITLPKSYNGVLSERIFTTKLTELSGNIFDPKTHSPQAAALFVAIRKSACPRLPLRDVITHRMAGDWGEDEDWMETAGTHTKCLVIRGTEFDNEFNLHITNGREKYRKIPTAKLARMKIEAGDLLIEKSGGSPDQPVGRVAILDAKLLNGHSVCYSNFVEKIKPDKSKVMPEFLFHYLRFVHSVGVTDLLQSQTNGIRNLMIHRYLDLPVSLPPMDKQAEIVTQIQSLQNQAIALRQQALQKLEAAKAQVEQLVFGAD